LTAETAPPATARLKVVGFQGASGDITATATGLASTSLNFTTLGLQVGQWIKIGDASAPATFSFAGAALNDWARVSGTPTATALPLDNRPSGWTTDAGTSRTIRVWFGDVIKNGTTDVPLSVERSFLGQATPTHIIHRGVQAGGLTLDFQSGQQITGSFDLMGLTSAQSTSAIGSGYVSPTTRSAMMTANADVGRVSEAGSAMVAPNSARRLQITLNNNARMLPAIGVVGAVGLGEGEAAVSGTLETYFGSNALLAKVLAGTVTSVSARTQKNNQALVVSLPRVTLTAGNPNAAAKNQDVTLSASFAASIDTTTNAHIQIDRLEYFN
jgi:hypothetical protein